MSATFLKIMSTIDIFKVYNRFGNLFRISHNIDKIFLWKNDPSERIGSEKTIFLGGKFYSYEGGGEEEAEEIVPNAKIIKSIITKQFESKLRGLGYIFKKKYITYKEQNKFDHPNQDIFNIFQGFEFRFTDINDVIFLVIDPKVIIETTCSIAQLVDKGAPMDRLKDFSVRYTTERIKGGIDGYLLYTTKHKIDNEGSLLICRVRNYRTFNEEEIVADRVFPEARPELIKNLLKLIGRDYDVVALQRKLSFLDSKTASKDRLFKTLEIARQLKKEVFPLKFGKFEIDLETEPVVIKL